MTDKIALSDIATFDNSIISNVNANNEIIEVGFNNTLSRDGTTPNTMGADLDLNGNNLLNVKGVTFKSIPTADPHTSGTLWSNAGVLTISAG
jgi:hypothetical protein